MNRSIRDETGKPDDAAPSKDAPAVDASIGDDAVAGGLLTEADVRAMVRLASEPAMIDGDLMAKRRHVAEALAALVDADMWIWSMFRRCEPDGGPMTIHWMHNLEGEDVAKAAAAATDTQVVQPENEALFQLQTAGEHFTRRRTQLIEDKPWYADPHTKAYRQGWINDFIYTIYPIDPETDTWSGLGLHRHWDRPAFTAREARMVHIVASEVRWLCEQAMPGSRGEGTQHLPPRLRPVLALLMDGHTRKRIAHDLGLSVHTVAGYIKEIYRHFDVSGRVPLMRHFMAGDGGDGTKNPRI